MGAEMSLTLDYPGLEEPQTVGSMIIFASQGNLIVPKFGRTYNLHGEQFLREPPADLLMPQDPIGTAAAIQDYIHEEIQRVAQNLPQGVLEDFEIPANPVDAMTRLLLMQRDHQN